ncbi:MAG: D-glycerate dehydrogenase [Chloroflexales bacterium]|nr:D-glycerate dehydrogenase [Chloroflexales bacterium]
MAKPKVFVTRIIPDAGFDLVKAACEVDLWTDELPPPYEVLLERVRGVDGLLCLLTDRIDAQLMDTAGSQLKVISNHAVGFDNIDLPAATARSIPVGNTPGILTDATADFAFSLLVSAARRVVEGDRYVRAGQWKTWGPSILLGPDVTGATLGIIGYGRIGQALAKRASGFDMRILYYDPMVVDPAVPGTAVDLETLLRESDFVSLHTVLNEQTRHLINRDTLALMKPNAILVNTSRGPVVDGQALYEALQANKIFAAALDVTDPEPLPMDSPLLELDNLVIAPHIASASKPTRDKMSLMAAQNLLAGLDGKQLPNCVNPEIYSQPQ